MSLSTSFATQYRCRDSWSSVASPQGAKCMPHGVDWQSLWPHLGISGAWTVAAGAGCSFTSGGERPRGRRRCQRSGRAAAAHALRDRRRAGRLPQRGARPGGGEPRALGPEVHREPGPRARAHLQVHQGRGGAARRGPPGVRRPGVPGERPAGAAAAGHGLDRLREPPQPPASPAHHCQGVLSVDRIYHLPPSRNVGGGCLPSQLRLPQEDNTDTVGYGRRCYTYPSGRKVLSGK
mmetsp:Transcript_49433/g.143337  ORF Transcript_49433/g.143337 Transcript_49433/m.143337 type:complete len:235 (+) Transcript_49433:220-924(+)